MTFAWHTSGERNEDGDYIIPEVWRKGVTPAFVANAEDMEVENEITIPKEFSYDYFDEKKQKYDKNNQTESARYWEWVRLGQYSKAVKPLYIQCWKGFAKKYSVDDELLPTFTQTGDNKFSLDKLAELLKQAESELVKQFANANHKLSTKFNKHTALQRLARYGATAWMMYELLEGKPGIVTAFANMRNFTKAHEKLDLSSEEGVILAYRNCKLAENSIAERVRPAEFKRAHGLGDVYENVDIYEIFNELCDVVGSYNINDIKKIQKDLQPALEEIKKKHALLLSFCEEQAKIKYITKLLSYKIRKEIESGEHHINPFMQFEDGHEYSVFERAVEFERKYVNLNELKSQYCPVIQKEITDTLSLLTDTIRRAIELDDAFQEDYDYYMGYSN